MGHAFSSYDKNSSSLLKKDSKVIEIEEEHVYFQFNSDGEINMEERQSEMQSFFNISKQQTFKRLKTIQNENNNSFQRKDKEQMNENLSSHSAARQSTNGKQS